MNKFETVYYNHTFKLSKKKIKDFENFFIKKKIYKTNEYWRKRQKKLYFEIDKTKGEIKVFNDTNLGNKLKKKNLVFIKLLLFLILRKIILFFNKTNKFNFLINNLKNNLNYKLNKLKIDKIKNKKLKKVLTNINKLYPERIKFFFYLDKYLTIYKKKNSYKYLFEVGAGPAINACLLNYKFKTKSIVVDLQIQNIIAFLIVSTHFPDLKIIFCTYKDLIKNYNSFKNALKYKDIIFLSPNDIKKIPDNICNISINTCAFQEMSKSTIKNYIFQTRRILVSNNLFLSINRVSKFLGNKDFYNFKNLIIQPLTFLAKPKLVFPKFNFSTRHIVNIFQLKKTNSKINNS